MGQNINEQGRSNYTMALVTINILDMIKGSQMGYSVKVSLSCVVLLKGHWTTSTSSPNVFFSKKLRFLYL